MANELLRIHDENNNCDLVAVANPMGNFHMSTYAEMQDGTQKPVDGWHLFYKMIEKLGQGGGSDPAVENAKETGGFGWTEEGKTDIVPETSFEINENTSPRFGYEDYDFCGVFNTSVDFRDIYNEYLSKSQLLTVCVNGVKYGVDGFSDEYDDEFVEIGLSSVSGEAIPAYMVQDYNSNTVEFYTNNGYVEIGNATIELCEKSETVHIIDNKYLSGGVTVVAFDVDSHENVTGSLSPAQVKNAMLTSIVVGTMSVNGAAAVPIGPAFYDHVTDSVSVGLYYGSTGLTGIIVSDPYGWNAG